MAELDPKHLSKADINQNQREAPSPFSQARQAHQVYQEIFRKVIEQNDGITAAVQNGTITPQEGTVQKEELWREADKPILDAYAEKLRREGRAYSQRRQG